MYKYCRHFFIFTKILTGKIHTHYYEVNIRLFGGNAQIWDGPLLAFKVYNVFLIISKVHAFYIR